MTTTFQRRYMWLAAMVASLALMVVSFGFAQVAVADQTDNIDTNRKGSLTIHKHKKPETPGNGDGEEIYPAPANPLSGVKFKVTKLNVDVADPKVWQAFDTLTYNGEKVQITYSGTPTDVNLGTPADNVTGGDGTAVFDELKAGAYLVEELEWTTAPDGQFIAEKAEPFFVTIPMKSPTSNAWNYDVHAYPKNSLSTVSKSVDDSNAFNAANEGELITWVVSAQMPAHTELTKVEIVDTFDSRIDPDSITVQKVAATPASGTETDISTENYTSTTDASKVTVSLNSPRDVEAQEVKVYFTGRVKTLKNEHTADDVLAASGVIPNKATVTINKQSTETNEVNTKWGDVAIFKYSQTNAKTPLQGAAFDIYRPNDSGQCDETNGTKIGSVTTDGNGRAYLRLKVGDNYCLVETKAPAGFKNIAEPVIFNVAEGKFDDTAGSEKNFVQVANEKTDYPALPLTGAAGKLVLIIIGASLLALAIGLLIVHKRHKRENQ